MKVYKLTLKNRENAVIRVEHYISKELAEKTKNEMTMGLTKILGCHPRDYYEILIQEIDVDENKT